ncbi:MAG: 50S ribosomal protein L25 [Planctomycetota bacterium]|nr:50S ribosomal protein L25 [Planctomycetota bacterium]
MNRHETCTLTATRRERVGSSHSRRLRSAGRLPAIVYGHGEKPAAIHIDAKEAIRHVEAGEKVFNIQFDGEGAAKTVLLKDIQFDYLGDNIVHADFTLVDLDERVEVSLPVHLKGEAKGLKTVGAILIHPTSEVTVECRVSDIIEYINLDVSELEAGDALHASDLNLPPDFTLVSDEDEVLAAIQIKAEEEAEGEEALAEGEAAEPEVITERKAEEKKDEED